MGGGFSEDSTRQFSLGYIGDILKHAILPATAILITAPIGWVMGMRNNMIQTLREDYTRLAIAKGLKPWKIALLYSARNAILPNVTGFAISLGGIMGGVVFIEGIFNYPGLGRLLFQAVGNRDYPLMQALFLFTTVGVLIANLLADFLYGWLDPRVRKGAS
jgi:peptide/nickel transport system permease protein